ncbi:MAG: hypothetical protein ACPIOQ_80835, partial [Promethearchaeia archaeon]
FAQRVAAALLRGGWAEAHIKIARMTLTIKLDGNWSSFQLAIIWHRMDLTCTDIAPSAKMKPSDVSWLHLERGLAKV